VTHCFLDLDPRNTDIYDSCINCGECITACNTLQAKKGRPGLLSFKLGEQQAGGYQLLKTRLSSLSSRVHWTIPFAVLGLAMFVWGLANYERYHLAVYRADAMHGAQINDYRVAISNKHYDKAKLDIHIEGLRPAAYTMEKSTADFDTVGRVDLQLHIKDGLKPGVHSFLVQAIAPDGWRDSYRVQHFVAKN
jgi:polyferredoxin